MYKLSGKNSKVNKMSKKITQPVAELAKEKEFNIPTNGRYYWDPEHLKIMFSKRGAVKCDNSDDSIAAPTQTRLQRWLREVHNIHIEMIWDYEEVIWFASLSYIGDLDRDCIDTWLKHRKTYEEALEVALEETLNLIGKK